MKKSMISVISLVLLLCVIGIGFLLFYPMEKSTVSIVQGVSDLRVDKIEKKEEFIIIDVIEKTELAEKKTSSDKSQVRKEKESSPPPVPKKSPPIQKSSPSNRTSPQKIKKSPRVVTKTSKKSSPPPTQKKSNQTKPKTGKMYIQLSAYQDKKIAQETQKRLIKEGIVSHIISENQGKIVWYKLRMGPYTRQKELINLLDYLRKKTPYRDSFVIYD